MEIGNGGLNDDEGTEVNFHYNDAVVNDPEVSDNRGRRQTTFVMTKESQGSPMDGFLRVQDWTGYCPRYDSPPMFAQVDNPGG